MSYKNIESTMDAVERKLGKANKIAAKGDDISYKDAIKLGQKSNSIVSTIKKGIKDYGVCRLQVPPRACSSVGTLY